MSRRFEDNMTKKHLWVRRLSSLLLLAGGVAAGCGSTVDDQDAGPRCAADDIFRYNDGLCGNGSPAGWCDRGAADRHAERAWLLAWQAVRAWLLR